MGTCGYSSMRYMWIYIHTVSLYLCHILWYFPLYAVSPTLSWCFSIYGRYLQHWASGSCRFGCTRAFSERQCMAQADGDDFASVMHREVSSWTELWGIIRPTLPVGYSLKGCQCQCTPIVHLVVRFHWAEWI